MFLRWGCGKVLGVWCDVFDPMTIKHEVNFVHVNVSTKDKESIMGPFDADDGPFLLFNDSHTMAHLLHMAGCFPSITQAKKNGWDKPIKKGYQQIRFGKSRLMIYILNTFTHRPCLICGMDCACLCECSEGCTGE